VLPTRPPRRAAETALVLVLLLTIVDPAAGAEDPEAERDRVREEQQQVESQLDVLRASEAELADELDRLAGAVASAEAELANAESAVAAAEDRIERIDQELADLDGEIERLTDEFQEAAINGYIGGDGGPLMGITERDPNQAAVRQALLDTMQGNATDLLDALHGAEAERQQARDEAEEARSTAEGGPCCRGGTPG